jgi:hypothetical protein
MKLNWGAGLLIFILFFVALCIIFIVFAFRQNLNLVSNNYYEKGVDFEHEKNMEARSVKYIDSVSVIPNKNGLNIIFPNGFISSVQEGSVLFYRPSDNRLDIMIKLVSDSTFISYNKLISGRYIAKISWIKNNIPFILEKDVSVK